MRMNRNGLEYKKILLIGATSGIGAALAERYAVRAENIAVTGRREDLLSAFCAKHPNACYGVVDVVQAHDAVVRLQQLVELMGGVDLIWLCAGVGTMNAQLDFEQEKSAIRTNVWGWTAISDWAYTLFERQGFGHLAVISSIAGTCGLFPAPAYAASKAYQISYLESLRQRAFLSKKPIFVTDVRPGFVRTPLLGDKEPYVGIVSVDKVVPCMIRAVDRHSGVLIVPGRWKPVVWLMKLLPVRLLAWILGKLVSK